jgi:hypothetical protein
MPYDLVIKNGMVVDGSGFSRYRADVAVKDGTIVEIGKIRGAAASTIDAEGQFVSPGIIDSHTHYDAQPFWDRLCTSSIWHGVTTVLMGNCGLTLAPLRPEHRDAMLATFCCVEDIPVRSLASVVPWNWENFDEYLNAIDIGLGLNLMPLVGHNPLRLSAMDQAAWDRAATPDEIARCSGCARAPRPARGLSTDFDPRRAAGSARRLAAATGARPRRRSASSTADHRRRARADLTTCADAGRADARVLPSLRTPGRTSRRPLVRGSALQLLRLPFNRGSPQKTTFFHNLDVVVSSCDPPIGWPRRRPERRAKMRDQALKPQRRRPGVPGRLALVPDLRSQGEARRNQGSSTRAHGAGEKQNKHVADVMLDLALEEGLDTEFQLMTARTRKRPDRRQAERRRAADPVGRRSLNTNFAPPASRATCWARCATVSLRSRTRPRYTFQPARIRACVTAA